MKTIGVGLLGLGTVGSAVARVFAERGPRLGQASGGHRLVLVAACVQDAAKPRDAGGVPLTVDPFAILDDPEVQIVVEVIGGRGAARDLQLAAFERGKHVVTANKELIARNWNEMHETARLAKRQLRFEAAVGASIPLIAAASTLGANRPRLVRGLINGTTNYICSRMESGLGFQEALAEAQALGYAEADPTNDVDGFDAAYKLAILISILDGRWYSPDNIRRTSLRELTPATIAEAAGRGNRVRYLATADFGQKATRARVGPEEVTAGSLEGLASGPTSVVTIDTDLAGELTFRGPGAGGDATASAILGDVTEIARSFA